MQLKPSAPLISLPNTPHPLLYFAIIPLFLFNDNNMGQLSGSAKRYSVAPSVPPTRHRAPGQKVSESNLKTIRIIGVGSCSQVRLARLKASGISVAMKVIKKVNVLTTKQIAHV